MFQGSIVALVTPFNEDGSVNFTKLGELIDFHCANKTDGIVILGTTGESPTLSFEEEEHIVEFAINRVAKRIPVIVGSGSNETIKARDRSVVFEKMGADALLVITPYYNRTNDMGMVKHFQTVADAVNIPIILYNVPGRTGCSISIDALKVLKNHPNIVGIKEASGNISYAAKVAALCDDNFILLSGNDDMVLPILSLGGKGVVSAWANICPQIVHEMVSYFHEKKFDEALKIQLKYLHLINNLFIETNPIPVKAAMNYLGYNVGPCRLPLYQMGENNYEKLIISINELKGEIR